MSGGLNRMLAGYFRPASTRKPDAHRKAREEAKRLAAQHGIEIEKLRDGGFNVYPPKGVEDDPYDGDHFANDWTDVLVMVAVYAGVKS